MSWRWLIFDYADPNLPLSFWQRMRASWRSLPIHKLPKELRRGRGLLVLATMPAGLIPILVLSAGVPAWNYFYFLVPFLLIYWVWFSVAYGVCCRKEHYYRLRLQGFNCCGYCGYWLRGLEEKNSVCPECGHEQAALLESAGSGFISQTRFRFAWLKDRFLKK